MSRATFANLRATALGGLRTGYVPHVAPVRLIIINERPATRADRGDPVKLGASGKRMEALGRYGHAVRFYLRALEAYPLVLRAGQRKEMTLLRRSAIRCEQLQVLQHQGRLTRRVA